MDRGSMERDTCDDKDLRALVLTPRGRDAILAEKTLADDGLRAQVCADLADLSLQIRAGAGSVIVAAEALPHENMDAWIGPEPPWSRLPFVVLLGGPASPRTAVALRSLESRPNVTFLQRPVAKRTLISTLRAAIEARRLQYTVRDALAAQTRLFDELNEQLGQLQSLYDSAPIGLALLDRAFRFQRINKVLAQINGRAVVEHLGKVAWEIVPDLQKVAEPLLQRVFDTGETISGVELRSETPAQPGVQRDWLERYYPLKAPDGVVVGVGVIVEDVTERKRFEEAQAVLSAELHHRVKNVLATVQAIVMQTLNSTGSKDDFAEALHGRLEALARAQDLLIRGAGAPLELSMLLKEALTPFGGEKQIEIAGGPIWLRREAGMAFCLIVHELATNAAKYGALSVPGGRITIDLQHYRDKGTGLLRWTERGGPPVAPPRRRGFGSRLIERCANHELKGEAKLAYRPDGIECVILFSQGPGACRSAA